MELECVSAYDLPRHIQGSTFRGVSFEIEINDVPLDLTGATIVLTVDTLNNSKSNVLTLSTITGNEKIVISQPPTNGIFRIIPHVINIPVGMYKYDIKITTADAIVRKPISGKWYIVPSATYE